MADPFTAAPASTYVATSVAIPVEVKIGLTRWLKGEPVIVMALALSSSFNVPKDFRRRDLWLALADCLEREVVKIRKEIDQLVR